MTTLLDAQTIAHAPIDTTESFRHRPVMCKPHSDLVLLIDAVARLNGRLRGVFAAVSEGTGLNHMTHTVLAAVVEPRRPPTVPQIGRSLGHPRQVIQRAANVLADAGLIAPAPNPEHKRANVLVPTDAGRRLQAQCNRKATAISEQLLLSIDPTRVREATALLHAIRLEIESVKKRATP